MNLPPEDAPLPPAWRKVQETVGASEDGGKETVAAPPLVRVPTPPETHADPGRPFGSTVGVEQLKQEAVSALQKALDADARFSPHLELSLEPLEILGRGGMGIVHRVLDQRLGREAALKRLAHSSTSPAAIRRFWREAEITARLDHPGIPPVYEAGTDADGQPYMLMKVIEGEPLSEVLRKRIYRRKVDRAELKALRGLLEVVLRVSEAVAYAHSQGVLHRDLKPANVVVGQFGQVMLLDWGLAKVVGATEVEQLAPSAGEPGESLEAATKVELTQSGTVLGTPGYMAPEQLQDPTRVDERADVFALGALLCEVLTGASPIEGTSVAAKLLATLAGQITSPGERRKGLPRALVAIAEHALVADPAARLQSAEVFAQDLRAFLAGDVVAAHHYSVLERALLAGRRHPRLAVGVAAVLLTTFAGWGFSTQYEKKRAHDAAQQSWQAFSDGQASDDLTGLGLGALRDAQRWYERVGTSAAEQERDAAARCLGDVALKGKDWQLASYAYLQESGSQAELVRERVDKVRLEPVREIGRYMDQLEQGELELTMANLSRVEELVAQAQLPETQALLCEALERLTGEIAAEQDRLVEARFRSRTGQGLRRRQRESLRAWTTGEVGPFGEEFFEAFPENFALPSERRALAWVCVQGLRALHVEVGRSPQAVTALKRLLTQATNPRLAGRAAVVLRRWGEVELVQWLHARYAHSSLFAFALARTETRWNGGAARWLLSPSESRQPHPQAARRSAENLEEARELARREDWRGCMFACNRALGYDESLAEAYVLRAQAYSGQGSPLLALADLDQASSLLNQEGVQPSLELLQRIREFRDVCRQDPRLGEKLARRAASFRGKGEWSNALEDATLALGYDSTRHQTWWTRGESRRHLGLLPGALSDLSRALQRETPAPWAPAAYAGRADVRLLLGDSAGALEDAGAALALLVPLPKQAELTRYGAYRFALRLRAEAHLLLGDSALALADAQRALELASRDPAPLAIGAEARRLQGDVEGALEDAERALRLDASLAFPHLTRGLIRLERDDRGGLEDLRRYLELAPEHFPTEEVKALLKEHE